MSNWLLSAIVHTACVQAITTLRTGALIFHCICIMLLYACIMLLYACITLLYACSMLVLCCCMLAYNYVYVMYAHRHILSTPFGECDTHRGTAYDEVIFSQHIPPSAWLWCRVYNAHAPGWGCGRLALLAPPSKQSE